MTDAEATTQSKPIQNAGEQKGQQRQKIEKNIFPRFIVGTSAKALYLYLVTPNREIEWVADVPKYKDNGDVPLKLEVPIFFKGSKPDDETKAKIFTDILLRLKKLNDKELTIQELKFEENDLKKNYEAEFSHAFPEKKKEKKSKKMKKPEGWESDSDSSAEKISFGRGGVKHLSQLITLLWKRNLKTTRFTLSKTVETKSDGVVASEFQDVPREFSIEYSWFESEDGKTKLKDFIEKSLAADNLKVGEISETVEQLAVKFHDSWEFEKGYFDIDEPQDDSKRHKVLDGNDESDSAGCSEHRTFTTEEMYPIAVRLMKQFHIKLIRGKIGTEQEEVWGFKDGYYQKGGEHDIRYEVGKELGSSFEDKYYKKVLNHIKAHTPPIYREDFVQQKNCINLLNGVLDYSSGKAVFKERRYPGDFANYNFMYILPVKYDPNSTCPEIDKVVQQILIDKSITEPIEIDYDGADYNDGISELLGENAESEEEIENEAEEYDEQQKVKIYYDYLGSIFLDDYRIKKAVVLLGKPGTGKTTLENIVIQFVGTRNKCAVTLHALETDRFASSNLNGMLANIVDEMPRVDLKNVEAFKNLTGGAELNAQSKFKDSFTMTNRAKMLFAANETPEIDGSVIESFFSRIVIIECTNEFPEDDKQTDLSTKDKKYSPEELSGLLNHAIKGLERLLKNERYEYDASEVPGVWNKYVKPESELKHFFESAIEITGIKENKMTSKELVNQYLDYSKLANIKEPLPENEFLNKVALYDPGRIRKVREDDPVASKRKGKRVRPVVWTGLTALSKIDINITSSNTKSKNLIEYGMYVLGVAEKPKVAKIIALTMASNDQLSILSPAEGKLGIPTVINFFENTKTKGIVDKIKVGGWYRGRLPASEPNTERREIAATPDSQFEPIVRIDITSENIELWKDKNLPSQTLKQIMANPSRKLPRKTDNGREYTDDLDLRRVKLTITATRTSITNVNEWYAYIVQDDSLSEEEKVHKRGTDGKIEKYGGVIVYVPKQVYLSLNLDVGSLIEVIGTARAARNGFAIDAIAINPAIAISKKVPTPQPQPAPIYIPQEYISQDFDLSSQ